MRRIAFVTTCKNRLHHLQQTLPLWVAEGPDEIVVVDYGCPQGTGDWVEANWPQVRVLRVTDDPGFCLSRARNLGAAMAEADWICFVDADILVQKGWVAWMRATLVDDHFYRPERLHGSATGTVILPRRAFEAVSGYDTHFRGWGAEDTDLYYRLKCAGWQQARYPAGFVTPIAHDDSERFVGTNTRERLAEVCTNVLYLDAKRTALTLGAAAGELPDDLRRRWREAIEQSVARWAEDDQAAPSIAYALDRFDWLAGPVADRARCEVTVAVQRQGGSSGGGDRRSFAERMRRRWRRVYAHLRGVPDDALAAIEVAIKAKVRPFADGTRAVPAGGIRLSLEGRGGRLPSPYCVRIRCEFTLLPLS